LIHRLRMILVASAAAGVLLVPAYALASPQVAYTTTFQASGPTMLPGDYYGSLTLTVAADGIVHGWYRPQYGDYVAVVGSERNGAYWLTFGDNGTFVVTATRQIDGTLKGTASNVDMTSSLYPLTFSFVADPAQR
jgi:hypothetical protein